MPGSAIEWYILDEFAVSANKQVARDPQILNLVEECVGFRIESVKKEIINPGPAKFAWWQADVVDDQQIYTTAWRPLILVG